MVNYGKDIYRICKYLYGRIERGSYAKAVNLSRTMKDDYWKEAKYLIFDVVLNLPLEQRLDFMYKLKFSYPQYHQVVKQTQCKGREHLKIFFDSVKRNGGEGVMLRKPNSPYEAGRSKFLRKHKGYFDTEVRFVKRDRSTRGLVCDQYVKKSSNDANLKVKWTRSCS